MDSKKHEIASIALMAIALMVLFSLASFHQTDPTLFSGTAKAAGAPGNWVGSVGAHIAWVLIHFLGIGAYGIPLAGLWVSWALFHGSPPLPYGRIQGLGIFLMALIACTILSVSFPNTGLPRAPILTGGAVGDRIGSFLLKELNALGTHILLAGTFLIGFILAVPFSLKSACSWIFSRVYPAGRVLCTLPVRCARSVSPLRAQPPEELTAPEPTPPIEEGRPSEGEAEQPPPVEIFFPPVPSGRKKRKKEALPPPSPQGAPGTFVASETGPQTGQYLLPFIDLLDTYDTEIRPPDQKKLEENSRILEEKLADFGVLGKVVDIAPGPVITMYEYAPAPGIKISRIVGLSDDLTMALKAISIRVVAPIPGKAAIGVEIPNERRQLVSIRTVLESEAFTAASFSLTIALGQDITGQPMVANLAKMPHLLIAGATGTGKSVGINTILSSLLFRNTPETLRLLLIDPKRIELSTYEGIPHLIHPVVTDAKMATRALRWAVQEMELRYRLLAEKNVRNIEGYNRTLAKEREKPAPEDEIENRPESETPLQHNPLPYLVIVIDELADLMMVASREVEESITRLAQMARAAGIHLILATQRPSVDVLTGIIKANIPTRISFQVSSRIDSRTILDGSGAESLLGSGDMLFLPPGTAKLQRIHGAYVSDSEVQRLTEHWRTQETVEDPLRERVNFHESASSSEDAEEELDEKYEEAVELVIETRQASISMLQRRLRVGYNRAARMIEIMEQRGIVGASDGVKPREVLGRG